MRLHPPINAQNCTCYAGIMLFRKPADYAHSNAHIIAASLHSARTHVHNPYSPVAGLAPAFAEFVAAAAGVQVAVLLFLKAVEPCMYLKNRHLSDHYNTTLLVFIPLTSSCILCNFVSIFCEDIKDKFNHNEIFY